MLTGLTDAASVKVFWPAVIDEFDAVVLEAQLAQYITRAELVLNRFGVLDDTLEGQQLALEMCANMLVRRLVLADKHPALVSSAANVRSESVHSVSWSMGAFRELKEFVGDEIYAILSNCIVGDSVVLMETERVFERPTLVTEDDHGDTVHLFDPRLDDNLDHTLSERLGIGCDPMRQGTD
jgi:hypothetical protein